MRSAAILFCLVWIGSNFSVTGVYAEPVPAVKPMEFLKQEPFLEGIDVPPVKPLDENPGNGKTESTDMSQEAATTEKSEACVVPGALVLPPPELIDPEGNGLDCGIDEPVSLEGVVLGSNTAKFSETLTISCEFAKRLTRWLRMDVLPAAEDQFGSPLSILASGPGYQCRRRNNSPDGKLSEHALGKAVDLSSFKLSNGTSVSVENDWGADNKNGRFLKTIHALACRRFTTVLGPDADPSHRSHFHVDIGCHGKSCTYLICQ